MTRPTRPLSPRWNATRALAVLRQRQGKRVPPPIQRMRSDDLMAAHGFMEVLAKYSHKR